MEETERYILTLSCQDRIGIVSSVTLHLTSIQGFILDSQQYADLETGSFFMRVEFKADGPRFPANLDALRAGFRAVSESLCLDWELKRLEPMYSGSGQRNSEGGFPSLIFRCCAKLRRET